MQNRNNKNDVIFRRRVLTLMVAVLFVFNELFADTALFALKAGAYNGKEKPLFLSTTDTCEVAFSDGAKDEGTSYSYEGSTGIFSFVIETDPFTSKSVAVNYIAKENGTTTSYAYVRDSGHNTISDNYIYEDPMGTVGEGCYGVLTSDSSITFKYVPGDTFYPIEPSPMSVAESSDSDSDPGQVSSGGALQMPNHFTGDISGYDIVFADSERGTNDPYNEPVGFSSSTGYKIHYEITINKIDRELIVTPDQVFNYGETVDIEYHDSYRDDILVNYGWLNVESPILMYKVEGADDTTYDTTAPTDPGKYEVQISAEEDDYFTKTYNEDGHGHFKIMNPDGVVSFNAADSVYGEALNVSASINNEDQEAVYHYVDEGGNALSEKPVNVGKYGVYVTFEAVGLYPEVITDIKNFEIKQADGSGKITVADISYGDTLSPVLESTTNGTDSVTIEYKKADEADTGYTATAPVNTGDYTARATFAATVNYKEAVATDDFTIKKATGKGSITVDDIKYGEKLSPIVKSETNGTDHVTITYKESSASDSTYSATEPSKAGDYTARAVFAATDNYEEVVATATFSIKEKEKNAKKDGTGTITIEDIVYGKGTVKPVLTSATNGIKNVKVSYKSFGSDDSSYTDKVPVEIGHYTARAVFAGTEEYNQVIATTDFNIYAGEKATGKAKVSIESIYYGMSLSPVVENDMKRKDYKLLYKKTGAPDSEYSEAAPTAIGNYVVKVLFEENKDYKECFAEEGFSITYMPAPSYELDGTLGNNDIYVSAVKVTPDKGYAVSSFLDGTYAKSLSFSEGDREISVYFMNTKTGGKSDAVAIKLPEIDTVKPVINGPKADEITYSDVVDISVFDLRLEKVTVNGVDISLDGNSYSDTLDADGGKTKYKIEAVDKAGNSKTLSFTLAASWLKEKVIPENKKVSLDKEESYTLDASSTWTKAGDDTVYQGGITFYVRDDEKSSFSKSGE